MNTSNQPLDQDKEKMYPKEEGFRIKKGSEREKIGIFNRLNVDKEQFMTYGLKMQEDLIKKRLANELKPEQIKSNINRVDQAYASLLTANQLAGAVEYGDAFYVNEPQVQRGFKDTDPHLQFDYRMNPVHMPDLQLHNRVDKGLRFQLRQKGVIDISKMKKSTATFMSIQNAELNRHHQIRAFQEVKEMQKEQQLHELIEKKKQEEFELQKQLMISQGGYQAGQ
ncbi:UNKNOWN [Stylonychia lemnae]|uniref:Uncharacterized protein n=1 Tax=Stylonychia lemnae TaxID=5949 RepID=A0A078B202_STYLE|nr:UNKNOWN [Stylonychia lemnae]|eukprot:CDW88585.1 UNKNOWN [Stylonychia lemnae]